MLGACNLELQVYHPNLPAKPHRGRPSSDRRKEWSAWEVGRVRLLDPMYISNLQKASSDQSGDQQPHHL